MRTVNFRAEATRFEMERGRGGKEVYHFPIVLEPAFSLFSHRKKRSLVPDSSYGDGASVEKVHPWTAVAVRVRPSREDKSLQELAEQFLLSLSCQVGFEIIAHRGRIACQVMVSPQIAPTVIAHLTTLYPKSEAFKAEDLLGQIPRGSVVVTNYRLRESHFFPLRTDFKLDTYGSLFGALAGLGADQFGAFQVILAPASHNWRENIRLAARSDFDPAKSVFYDLPDLPKIANRKVAKPLFAVSVRLAGSSVSVVSQMERFLSQFEGDNSFVPVRTPHPAASVFGRTVHSTGMLLNAEELARLVHVPAPEVISRPVESADRAAAPPPMATRQILIPLGINRHRGAETLVGIPEGMHTRHSAIVGTSGAGKTTLIVHLLVSLAEQGYPFAFIDPAGDAARQLVGLLPRHRQNDCVYFDPANRDFPPAFNVLESADERQRQLLCSDLMVSFENYYRNAWGPRMAMMMRNVINLLFNTTGEKTLLDIRRVLMDGKYREELLSNVGDPQVLDFWRNVYTTLPKGSADPILNKLSEFVDNPLVRNVIGQPNLVDANRIMNENGILIASLCKGLLGEDAANLLGSFLLSKFRMGAMARAGMPPEDRRLFTVVVDEAQNYANTRANASIMTSFLSEARKYRVALVMATQFLNQLHQDAVAGILGNVGTLVVFRSGIPDSQLLERELGTFIAEDVLNLAVGEALVRMGTANSSFNVKVPAPRILDLSLAEETIRLSQARYCRSRDVVEEMIGQRSSGAGEEAVTGSSEELSPAEHSFLKYVWDNSNLPTTATYKALGLSNYSGNRMKQSLIKRGLLCEVRTKLGRRARIAKFLIPSQVACQKMGLPPYHGRGGPVHQYLQSFVRQQAEARGYGVHVEHHIPGGDENIDVVIEKDGIVTAVEIAVSSTGERELHNIKKCLAAGYGRVLSLLVDASVLEDTRNLAGNSLDREELAKVSFGNVNEVSRFL